MAIAYVSSTNNTASSFSFDATGSNYLVAFVTTNTATQSSVTYNGVSMTPKGNEQFGGGANNWIQGFILANPTTGSNTVAITGGAGQCSIASYSGVFTTAQGGVDTFNKASVGSGGSSIAVSVTTTTANDWLIFGSILDATNPSSYVNATARQSISPFLADSNGGVSTGSNTITVNYPTTQSAAILIALLSQAPPSPGIPPDFQNPRFLVIPVTSRTQADPFKLELMIGKDQFFGSGGPEYDYPNPRGREYPSSLRSWLASPFGGLYFQNPPDINHDWPNPRGAYTFAITNRTHVDFLKLNLIGQDGTVRDVLITRREPLSSLAAILSTFQQTPNQLILVPTFFGAGGANQFDWPVPKGKQFPAELRTIVDPLKLLLQGQDKVSAGNPNYDWPNPKGAYTYAISNRTHFDPLKFYVSDQFFGLGGAPNFDQPNPRGPEAQKGVQVRQDQSKIILIGQDQFGNAGNPTFDWPNPKGPQYPVALRTLTDAVKLLLNSKDKFFGLAGNPTFDWPVPKGTEPQKGLRTFEDSSKIRLIGKDQFFGGAGQAPIFDLSLPPIIKTSNDLRGWLFVPSIGLYYPPLPNLNYDFPNPRGYQYLVSLRNYLDPTKIQLIGHDQFFGLGGPSYDYPNPRGAYTSAISNRTHTDALKLLLQDQFFGLAGSPNFDWPNPRGKEYPVSLRTATDLVKLNLIGQDHFFGAGGANQFDWPVPKGKQFPSDLRTIVDPLKLLLQGQDKVSAGNPNYDWPNPKGKQLPSDLRTFLGFAALGLYFPMPFAQVDWTVPKGPLHGVALRTHMDQLKLNLIAQDLFFGTFGQGVANLDWPVPKGPIPGISLKSHLDVLKLLLQGKDHFFGAGGANQFDWPVPKGPRAPIDLRTWIASLSENAYALIQPFMNYDWPVPKGYPYPAELRTFIGFLALIKLGIDQFYGAPGQPPEFSEFQNLDWAAIKLLLIPLVGESHAQQLLVTMQSARIRVSQPIVESGVVPSGNMPPAWTRLTQFVIEPDSASSGNMPPAAIRTTQLATETNSVPLGNMPGAGVRDIDLINSDLVSGAKESEQSS